jgi:hypothetical protein
MFIVDEPSPLKNLEEVFTYLNSVYDNTIKEFMAIEDNALSLHYSLGRWMRNNLGLWGDSELKQDLMRKSGLNHPDDLSNFILKSYSEHLRNR